MIVEIQIPECAITITSARNIIRIRTLTGKLIETIDIRELGFVTIESLEDFNKYQNSCGYEFPGIYKFDYVLQTITEFYCRNRLLMLGEHFESLLTYYRNKNEYKI